MANPDQIQRFLFREDSVRGEIVGLRESYKAVLSRHDYSDFLKLQLGQFMSAAALLSSTLKFEGSLNLQFQGAGCIRLLVAECSSQKNLRAIARWDSTQVPTESDLRSGQLTITIEPEKGQRYQGIIEFGSSGLAASLEDYFLRSEQLRTRLWLACDGETAAGLLLQTLPISASESSLEHQSEYWTHLTALTDTCKQEELLALVNDELLFRFYHQEEVELFPPHSLQFHCSCSAERSANALVSLGEEDALRLLEEQQGSIEIDCQFCHQKYYYDKAALKDLFPDSTH